MAPRYGETQQGEENKKEGETKEKKEEEEVSDLRKEAFQLANYYFVFQGVIFTAIYSSPTKHKCQYHWVPITLSLFAGILNLSALATIAVKYKRILDEKDRKLLNGASSTSRYASMWRLVYAWGCMLLFFGFFVVTLIGSIEIPCKGNDPKNCVKICDQENCITICQ